jgi:hypothetical protein
MLLSGIQLGASSHPASGPEAERQYVMLHERRSRALREAALFLVVLMTCSTSAMANSTLEFGLVERSGEGLHLHSERADLAPDSQVVLIESGAVFYVQRSLDRESEKASYVLVRSKPCTVYLLRGTERHGLGFIPSPAVILPVEASSKVGSGFRSSHCTSSEGAHHSVWETRGTDEVRVWSAYQYLPYAVVPSCSESEFAE